MTSVFAVTFNVPIHIQFINQIDYTVKKLIIK